MSRLRASAAAAGLSLAVALPLTLPAHPAATAGTDLGAGTAPGSTATSILTDERALSRPAEDSYYPAKGDPTVDALHYDLDLTWLRARRELRGVTTLRFRVTRDDTLVRLDLSSRLSVGSVRLDGERTRFTHDGNQLLVAAAVAADERHTLRVAYRGTPGTARGPASRPDVARVGMRVTRAGELWTMQEPFGGFTWYAVNDHPSDKAVYDVRVDAPGGWVGVSNGELVRRRTSEGRTVTRWRNHDPMPAYLLTVAVGPYRAYRQTGPRGLPITHWVPRHAPELVEPLLRTPAALRWLERRLGPYPYDSAGVVLTPAGSAMETQTMVTFGVRNYGYGPFAVRSVVVHELAHHWWGDAVTPSDWRDVWMNEGMATYLEARWADQYGNGPGTTWRWSVRAWADDDQWLRDLYGPPGRYFRDEFASSNVYSSVALMWERLRRRLGDETFSRLVRRWPQTQEHGNSDRDALVAWWSARSGEDLRPFFNRWLDSTRSPA